MQASQVYDDVEAVIMAADEHPEYREQIIEGFIDQVLRRRKRRFTFWRTTALLLVVGGLGTLLIDRLISFPLSLFALVFLWIVIVGVWASCRIIAVIEHHAVRFALMWLVTRMTLRRSLSNGIFGLIPLSLAKAGLKRLISAL
jgi:fatty acid desaturase